MHDVLCDAEHEPLRGGFDQSGHGREAAWLGDRRVGGEHLKLFGGDCHAHPGQQVSRAVERRAIGRLQAIVPEDEEPKGLPAGAQWHRRLAEAGVTAGGGRFFARLLQQFLEKRRAKLRPRRVGVQETAQRAHLGAERAVPQRGDEVQREPRRLREIVEELLKLRQGSDAFAQSLADRIWHFLRAISPKTRALARHKMHTRSGLLRSSPSMTRL